MNLIKHWIACLIGRTQPRSFWLDQPDVRVLRNWFPVRGMWQSRYDGLLRGYIWDWRTSYTPRGTWHPITGHYMLEPRDKFGLHEFDLIALTAQQEGGDNA